MKRRFVKFNKTESPKTFCKVSIFGLQVLFILSLTTNLQLGIPTDLWCRGIVISSRLLKYVPYIFDRDICVKNNNL